MKNIIILATGGTIAGKAASEEATTGYKAGAAPAEELLDAVPEIRKYAGVPVETISSIDSKDMTEEIWLTLARRVHALTKDRNVDGLVITHGTDTMEETAFFLALATDAAKPVVLTGAMRPATAISADGPMNLLAAVKLAASEEASGRGILVTMNDDIFSALDVRKTDTLSLDTFASPLGPVGRIEGGRIHFYRKPERSLPFFEAGNLTSLPKVYILYGHAGADGKLVRAALSLHPAGLVYAGTGNGSIHAKDEEALREASESGVIVVRASHVAEGPVIPAEKSYEEHGFLSSGSLSPKQSAILLKLALAKGKSREEIKELFAAC